LPPSRKSKKKKKKPKTPTPTVTSEEEDELVDDSNDVEQDVSQPPATPVKRGRTDSVGDGVVLSKRIKKEPQPVVVKKSSTAVPLSLQSRRVLTPSQSETVLVDIPPSPHPTSSVVSSFTPSMSLEVDQLLASLNEANDSAPRLALKLLELQAFRDRYTNERRLLEYRGDVLGDVIADSQKRLSELKTPPVRSDFVQGSSTNVAVPTSPVSQFMSDTVVQLTPGSASVGVDAVKPMSYGTPKVGGQGVA